MTGGGGGYVLAMTDQLTRPTEGDVVDLILDDHRSFEALLRQLRDATADRDAARRAFAALHVAHAEAEEHKVYPTLRRKDAISEHEEEHGEHEHAEGHEKLLAVLEADRLEGEEFDDLVEELATAVNHHLTEEELTILNPAREEVTDEVRAKLGTDFAEARNALLDEDCGSVENVRRIVEEARREGQLEE
jgi:Hemerythrin HHE cation binding domain